MLAHDPLVSRSIARVAVVRADDAGQLGRAPVRRAGHQRRDRRGQGPAAVRVVRVAGRHQQRAEVRITDTELPVRLGDLGDLLRREVGEADRDVHRRDHELDRLDEPLRVECAVLPEKLQEVERGEIARRIVQRHVFRAVRHHHTTDDVGVVARLGEVVCRLEPAGCARDQPDGLVYSVERMRGEQRIERHCLLGMVEPDHRPVSGEVPAADPQVV